jgi:hypothetical protein
MVRKITFSPCIGYPDQFYGLAITHQMTNETDHEKCSLSRYLVPYSRSQGSTVEQLRRDLRKWLCAPDPSTNHNIARGVHHEGTATWFFQGGIFKEWKSKPSLLWIYGKREFFTLCHSAPADTWLYSGSGKERPLVCDLSVVVAYLG